MHETLQVAICRAILISAVGLPVAVQAIYSVWTASPWHRRAEVAAVERLVEVWTGAAVRIQQVQRLSPSTWQLEGVTLAHPESQAALMQMPSAVATRHSDGWMVRGESIHIAAREIAALSPAVHDLWLCRRTEPLRVQVVCERAAFDLGANDQSSSKQQPSLPPGQLAVVFETEEDAALLKLSLDVNAHRQIDQTITKPLELVLRRVRPPAGEASSTLQVECGDVELPADLIATVWPAARGVGEEASFHGAAAAQIGTGGYRLLVRGLIRRASLETLTASLAYRAAGRAEVMLETAEIADGRLVSLAGTLGTGEATIATEWLNLASYNLGLRLRDGALNGAGTMKTITESKVIFQLADGQMRLMGGLPPPTEKFPPILVNDGAGNPLVGEAMVVELQPQQWINWIAGAPVQSGVSTAAYVGETHPIPTVASAIWGVIR